MRTYLTASAAALALVVSAGVASAATYDFGLLATGAGVGEGSWDSRGDATNVAGGDFTSGQYIVDGIGVSATGYVYDAGPDSIAGPHTVFSPEYEETYAYLDGLSGGKEAGLGVCGMVTGSFQCDPSNDDNTGPDGGLFPQNQSGYFEFVTLTFDELVQFTNLGFRDDNHNPISSGLIGLSIDDPTSGDMTFVVTDISTLTGINTAHNFYSMTWSFAALSSEQFCSNGPTVSSFNGGEPTEYFACTDFYIDGATVSAIPVPAAGWLLLGGLGGLAAMRRRKKA